MYLNVPHLAATYLRSDIFNHLNVSLVMFCYYFGLTEIFVLHFLTTRNNINKKQHGVSKLGFISYDYVLMNRILQATISAWRELKSSNSKFTSHIVTRKLIEFQFIINIAIFAFKHDISKLLSYLFHSVPRDIDLLLMHIERFYLINLNQKVPVLQVLNFQSSWNTRTI